MMEIDDLRTGMEPAFEAVFGQYHQKLYFFFLKHTGDATQAAELVQVTFVRLWQHREKLSTGHTLSVRQ